MKTYFTTRVLNSDVAAFKEKAEKCGISQCDLFQMAANMAEKLYRAPRSREAVGLKMTTYIAVRAQTFERERWEEAAKKQGVGFHLWAREAVIPLALEMEIEPKPLASEEVEKTVQKTVRKLQAQKEHFELFQAAADSQWMTLDKWMLAALLQSARRDIAQPRVAEGPVPEVVMVPTGEYV